MSLEQCKLLNFSEIDDKRGKLCYVEENEDIPFDIARIYYLYDVPHNEIRGEHAHIELEQVIIAVAGSFDVVLDDGMNKKRYHLNNPSVGLYICPMTWRILDNFEENSVCMVFASKKYSEGDYIRNYQYFLEAIKV